MSVRLGVRNAVAHFLFQTGLTRSNRRSRQRLAIVTFHRVLPEPERQAYPFPGLVVTPQELDLYLAYSTEHFDCGALATQHERYVNGEAVARPLLALTFDDA